MVNIPGAIAKVFAIIPSGYTCAREFAPIADNKCLPSRYPITSFRLAQALHSRLISISLTPIHNFFRTVAGIFGIATLPTIDGFAKCLRDFTAIDSKIDSSSSSVGWRWGGSTVARTAVIKLTWKSRSSIKLGCSAMSSRNTCLAWLRLSLSRNSPNKLIGKV
jgi:hypothetical protein